MRFLKAKLAKEEGILQVVERNANQIPPYAILSHTWEEDEVKFEDIESGRANDVSRETLEAKAKSSPFEAKSLLKLKNACAQAADDGYEYIWVDTCCIDKRSSAELSEAINSMFAWYRDAKVCYAFLLHAPDDLDTAKTLAQFSANRWFQRGFTLQELLAPRRVVFFSGRWIRIGVKSRLSDLLARITGIDAIILRGRRSIFSASVARRMSWAAKRVTTRPEDSAYCLMGIFSVNMPMLYGEGAEKAFIRLQEEIMKQSDDQSLFAWVNPYMRPSEQTGLLASYPSCFLDSNDMIPYQDWEPRASYAMTNCGLKIDLHLTPVDGDIFLAALNCPVPPDYKDANFLALYLWRLPGGDERYVRIKAEQTASVSLRDRGGLRTVYVRQNPELPSSEGVYLRPFIQLSGGPPNDYSLARILYLQWSHEAAPTPPIRRPARYWVPSEWPLVFPMRRKPGQLSVALLFQRGANEQLAILIGTVDGYEIALYVCKLWYEVDLNRLTFTAMESIYVLMIAGNFRTYQYPRICTNRPVIHCSSRYYMIDFDFLPTTFQEFTLLPGIIDILG
ncbi:HET-domain-containing protein [Hypoxylon sp. FL1150]|nr:HET-domain-containing protein [Hypoxylon sp. FL1150]